MSALKTILYFSIFKYPITKEEIYKFSKGTSTAHIEKELELLIAKKIIYKHGEFYTTTNDDKLISRRLKGNEMAQKMMPKAKKVARLIAKFPYVESVCVSGSLSKGYYDAANGDIDFFVITKKDRLWVSRTLLILYKKIFLLNSKKYFCVNYFISTNNLEISEKNRFTATEMVTLIPLYGKATYQEFMQHNPWPKQYFPNISPFDTSLIEDTNKAFVSKTIEAFFNTKIGLTFDTFFRYLTLKKWQKKFDHLQSDDFNIAMKSTKNVSKHHPQNFQRRVIDKLNDDYNKINLKYNLEIVH